jgi:hypothetical protein
MGVRGFTYIVAICVVRAVHVGCGIGYFDVQNAWALVCVFSGWNKLHGSFVHLGPATTCWTRTASGMTGDEYSIFLQTRSKLIKEVARCYLGTTGDLYTRLLFPCKY